MTDKLALEKAIDFIESLTRDPLITGVDDIEMTLEDVQEHARIELASIRKVLDASPQEQSVGSTDPLFFTDSIKPVPHAPTPEILAAAMRADQDGMPATMKTIWMVMWGAYTPPETNSVGSFEATVGVAFGRVAQHRRISPPIITDEMNAGPGHTDVVSKYPGEQPRPDDADNNDDLCSAHASPFQSRVQPWMMACFGPIIAGDREERNYRFLEEALELVQSTGCTASEAHQLVDNVYGRPIGDPNQEVGGVMVTLAALCLANMLDMHGAGETELARIWTKVDQIRAKHAAKPKNSPLPGQPVTEAPL